MELAFVLALFFGGYFMQNSYDICKEAKFQPKECKLQKEMNKYEK